MTRCIIEDDVTLTLIHETGRVKPLTIADMTLRLYEDGDVTLSIGHTEIEVSHVGRLREYADKRLAEELQAIP